MASTGNDSRPGRHVIEGEYLHKGIVFCDYFPKETIEGLYDYNYKPADIILATYPKCGKLKLLKNASFKWQFHMHSNLHHIGLRDLVTIIPETLHYYYLVLE